MRQTSNIFSIYNKKKSIPRHPIFIIDADHDYILDGIVF